MVGLIIILAGGDSPAAARVVFTAEADSMGEDSTAGADSVVGTAAEEGAMADERQPGH
ncbi:MAG: hypothetical protein ACLQU4_22045 [Limisphaerales bacterium]